MAKPIRQKIEENVGPYLEPGETVQSAFIAVGGLNPWLQGLMGIIFYLPFMKPAIIVATDRRIIVFKANTPVLTAATKPKEVLATYPRETKFGPVKGVYAKIHLGGNRYYVHKRFHKDIRAADAAAAPSAPGATPA